MSKSFLSRGTISAAAAMATELGLAAIGSAIAADSTLPSPDHVVVVVMENHSFAEIMQSGNAPFIRSLALHGAMFTNSFAIGRPSQPNYFALFAGSTQGVSDNSIHQFD